MSNDSKEYGKWARAGMVFIGANIVGKWDL